MGLRLTLLDWWTPKQLVYRELDRIAAKTTDALKEVIKNNTSIQVGSQELHLSGSLEQRRNAMAKLHTALVNALVEAVGRDQAIMLGREALFRVGRELGDESRRRLGVQEPNDIVKAANIMYRVLGIEFRVNWIDKSKAVLTVHHCALAKEYSELTCQILSATDEGTINGLMSNARMQFNDKLTGNCSTCTAEITLEEKS
jgi:predicted ArsR family transcriptional regulator